MLSLSISSKPCIPDRRQAIDPNVPRSKVCEICGAPGGEHGELLEGHVVATGKTKHICPICHHCLHLDYAGMKKSGRIIWLPEVSQETLNLLSLAMFLVVQKSAPAGDGPDELLVHAKNLYGTFRKRAEHVEVALGANVPAMERLGPKSNLSEPQHIASLMAYAKKATGMSERQMAERVQGMRFLPNPNYFARYTDAVGKIVDAAYPVSTWMTLVSEFREAEKARLDAMPDESFDAQGIAQFAEPMEEDMPTEPDTAPEPA